MRIPITIMMMMMIIIIIIIIIIMPIPTGYRFLKIVFYLFFTLMLTVLKINSQKVLKIARARERKHFVTSTSFLW